MKSGSARVGPWLPPSVVSVLNVFSEYSAGRSIPLSSLMQDTDIPRLGPGGGRHSSPTSQPRVPFLPRRGRFTDSEREGVFGSESRPRGLRWQLF